MAGIRGYSNEVNSRQRLRMAARPLLQLIHRQLEQRKAAGGTVQFEHVRAHSDASDIHSVGNRLADYKANATRARPQSATPSSLRELPLADCEHHLTVWTDLGNGPQVIDDVRRTAIVQLKAQRMEHWRNQPAADTMDGAFAGAALLETSKVLLSHGSPAQQATLLHIATNSIQCRWQLLADGATRRVQPLQCDTCGVSLTLTHLVTCLDHTVFRYNQRIAVLALLASDARTSSWTRCLMHQHLPLMELLLQLFPLPLDTSPDKHFARVLCGVFSSRQANAASKSLGFACAEDSRRLMQQLRLICVKGVHNLFESMLSNLYFPNLYSIAPHSPRSSPFFAPPLIFRPSLFTAFPILSCTSLLFCFLSASLHLLLFALCLLRLSVPYRRQSCGFFSAFQTRTACFCSARREIGFCCSFVA